MENNKIHQRLDNIVEGTKQNIKMASRLMKHHGIDTECLHNSDTLSGLDIQALIDDEDEEA